MTHTLLKLFFAGLFLISYVYSQDNQTTLNLSKSKILDAKTDELTLKLKSQYLSQDSKISKTNRFQARLEVALTKEILPTLNFDFETAFNLESGQSDTLYRNANEFEPDNNMVFRKGEFVWAPLDYKGLKAFAKAGALKLESDEGHDLLIGPNVFLGVSEHAEYSLGDFSARFAAYQTGPRNVNTSNRLDEVEEGDPRFFMESLTFVYGDDEEAENYVKYNYSQFAFSNLSNSVAGASYLFGNSINLQDEESGEFAYSYIGSTMGLSGNLRISSFGLGGRVEALTNDSAPENNEGSLYGAYISYYKGDSRYSFGVESFRTEADATVAYYANSIYRRTNVEGQKISIDYENKLSELELGFDWVRAKDINDSYLTDDSSEDIVVFFIRKSYEIL